MKHTLGELKQMQSLPLEIKIKMTERRIEEWVKEFGIEGVSVSFSGGKDSTVLLDIARRIYPTIQAVFVDVPTQYPELRDFAKTYDNVEILRPQMNFMQVCETYGFPIISKEASRCVWEGKRMLERMCKNKGTTIVEELETPNFKKEFVEWIKNSDKGDKKHASLCFGLQGKDNIIRADVTAEDKSIYSQEKWGYVLVKAPFEVSNECCSQMKKKPLKEYERRTGRKPITAQMAEESRLRATSWLRSGCNAFEGKHPMSNPMSFWTEQDVLRYIVEHNLPICSVYGDVVEDFGDNVEGQTDFFDFGIGENHKVYKTTGCKRTGCMLCGFGCHLDESPNRFELLKETHPKMYALMDKIKNNGVSLRQAIEWLNENGGTDIKL